MNNFNADQQYVIDRGKAMRLNTTCYEDPDYSAERMSTILEALLLQVPQADMNVMLDKRMSDSKAWDLLRYLVTERTAEEFILDNDELV